ncbi:hypothetical protein [Methylorubrum sp. SB2]|uniref:hypothetical protein n=1 Tax=Methylorubrum subtropicum TaxID=3138812 RepID=UPI00313D6CDA
MTRNVYFMVGPKVGHWGSAFLRAHQVKDLVALPLARRNVSASVTTNWQEPRNAVVILNKTAIHDYGLRLVETLRAKGNVVALDPVDAKIGPDRLGLADAVISCSREQTETLRADAPGLEVHFVPHHVDLRITPEPAQAETFSCGYFGAPDNGLHVQRIPGELLTVVSASDAKNDDWMRRLAHHNCHYLIRNARHWDGYKPFTKGYIAAAKDAVVIVSAKDREAQLHLGPLYPYVYDVTTLEQAIESIEDVKASFGSSRWATARDIMQDVKYVAGHDRVAAGFVNVILRLGARIGF